MHFGAMKRIVFAEALPGWRLHLRYDDGVEGTVDLSAKVGCGVFAAWRDPVFFKSARCERGRRVVWGEGEGEIDLCADALYLQITGLKPEDIIPALRQETAHA
jgi:hypothetical protein